MPARPPVSLESDEPDALAARLAPLLRQRLSGPGRQLVALAGPPASGKSTLAEALVEALGREAVLVPMDGFHLDNAVLDAQGWRPRKGAPHTFDAAGVLHALRRIRRADEPVAVPVFDRAMDLARAGARIVTPDAAIVVVEGNYLLLDEPVWRDIAALFDLTIRLDVPDTLLRTRLVRRWLDNGHDEAAALARAEGNDLPNARTVQTRSLAADIRIAG